MLWSKIHQTLGLSEHFPKGSQVAASCLSLLPTVFYVMTQIKGPCQMLAPLYWTSLPAKL